jgi:hypothetical protein
MKKVDDTLPDNVVMITDAPAPEFDLLKYGTYLKNAFGIPLSCAAYLSRDFIENLERTGILFRRATIVGHSWPHERDSTLALRLSFYSQPDILVCVGAKATHLIAAFIAGALFEEELCTTTRLG